MIPPDPTTGPFGGRADRLWLELVGRHAVGLGGQDIAGERHTGIFTISSYENGYFWGSGTAGAQSFNVFGSVTPEGTCSYWRPPVGRRRRLRQGSSCRRRGRYHDAALLPGRARYRPGVGRAASLMSAAGIIPPTDVPNFAIPGQSASVQALGQNALPATDVPATWPAAGVLANATPWALVDGAFTALGGVTRIDSLEVGQLGNFAGELRSALPQRTRCDFRQCVDG